MTIAIETRFCGPTDTKGPRVIATTANGQRHVISYVSELSCEAAHRRAATELAESMGWLTDGERLVSGSTKRGFVFVLIGENRREQITGFRVSGGVRQ